MSNPHDLITRVRSATESSELQQAVTVIKQDGGISFALGAGNVRALSAQEITELEKSGNTADDWSRVRVAEKFEPRSVRASSFHGNVLLGCFADSVRVADEIDLPSGVYNSTLADCVVGNNSLVRDVRLLGRFVVGANAVLLNCGSITCDAETTFGNGTELPVGLETGGREVLVFAEIDVEVAAAIAKSRSEQDLLNGYVSAVADYVSSVTSNRGIIAEGATIRDTPQVRNVYAGPFAKIDGATLVADSTLLSSKDEPAKVESGACVMSSVIQWGSDASTMAIVDRSVLTEHSHVERHGKVTESILGPNTGVAEGEATACLLGPFVGFHHQSLLIAALWPEGKGNVGYGANVGSNHTSKAPDQEIWPGEGAFFGLGVNIKFPSDFSRAPYSIVASGVNALPQKVTFPFSLINSPSASYSDISPAYNEIIPAWLLTDNMFTLRRNEGKYKDRNKARRTEFQFDVFRPDTVDLMRDACRRLESVPETKQLYSDRDIKGLGKNYLLESNRQPAIEAYQFYIKYYALLGLYELVKQSGTSGSKSTDNLLTTSSDNPVWEHQRKTLHGDLGVTSVAAALREFPTMLEKVARDVEQSKAKDDHRGARIIDDYAEVHPPAADDKFVRQTWQETRETIGALEELIGQLK